MKFHLLSFGEYIDIWQTDLADENILIFIRRLKGDNNRIPPWINRGYALSDVDAVIIKSSDSYEELIETAALMSL